ncbi:DUF4179 domain-containing protein [Paenibacillus chitinolyticus]|uniref:DUF4179 domain-containing protein n=1 Tax=Paenibacillus chitinolyticus TaxID=79263 RepID=UPI00362A607C
MNKIENLLKEENSRLSRLTAPENMEARLRRALHSAAPKRTTFRKLTNGRKIAVAAILALMLIIGDQYHALAYYGKILLGFDGILNDNLKKLNQQEWGQPVGEQAKLADGTLLTVDGIMSDENQFIVYYTLSNPKGLVIKDTPTIITFGEIKGYQTFAKSQGGSLLPNKDQTEIKGFSTFEPVNPLAKKLTLSYWDISGDSSERREGHLAFRYHPDEAMPTRIKQSIHQTLTVDGSPITFGSITATPTMTLIEGTVQEQNKKLFDQIHHGVEIVANGEPIKSHDIRINKTENGYTFSLRYDPLPENLTSVQIVLAENGGKVDIPIN